MARFGSLGTQYFDNAGNPLISGFIQFYESGTTTDKDTFADVNLSIANPNPVPLSAAGRQPNIFFNGTANAILFTSDMVQVEARDPVGGETGEGAFSNWNSITIFDQPDIVVGSNELFYLSITDGNQGNDPTTDAVNWSEIRFIRLYNSNEVYDINRIVEATNGLLYSSLTANNLNNNPIGDIVNWKPSTVTLNTNAAQAKTANYVIAASDNRSTIECNGTFFTTLPDAATIISLVDTGDFQVTIKNVGTGAITIDRTTGTDTVDGAAANIFVDEDTFFTLKVNAAADGYNIITGLPSGLRIGQFLRNDENDTTTGSLTVEGSFIAEAGILSDSLISETVNSDLSLSGNGTGGVDIVDELKLSGASITADAVDLNRTDITTEGDVEASKSLTADSGGNVDFVTGTELLLEGVNIKTLLSSNISKTTIAGSAASSITVSSISETEDTVITLVGKFLGSSALGGLMEIIVNGDTTDSNYELRALSNGGGGGTSDATRIYNVPLGTDEQVTITGTLTQSTLNGSIAVHLFAASLDSASGDVNMFEHMYIYKNSGALTSFAFADNGALLQFEIGSSLAIITETPA